MRIYALHILLPARLQYVTSVKTHQADTDSSSGSPSSGIYSTSYTVMSDFSPLGTEQTKQLRIVALKSP